jgi:hypothetical protein
MNSLRFIFYKTLNSLYIDI